MTLKIGDCVVVTRKGRETMGYVDHIRGDTVWVDLDARIDGFLHMPLPVAELRLYPERRVSAQPALN